VAVVIELDWQELTLATGSVSAIAMLRQSFATGRVGVYVQCYTVASPCTP